MTKLKDVALAAGVSIATVSLALNGSPLVNADTREKVTALAYQMGYAPNTYARKLVNKRSGSIGIIVPDIENSFYASLVRYINDFLKDTEYSLYISISGNEPELEDKAIRDMISNRMEGIIYIPIIKPREKSGAIEALLRAEMPVVCATTLYPSGLLPCVMSDLYRGMYEMTVHVLEKGYRRIAYITGRKGTFALDTREEGFTHALRDSHFECEVVKHTMDEVTYQAAYEGAEDLLASGAIPEAVICVNDIMALGVINTLHRHGIRVPDDVAVTGFDDGIFAEASPVPITTVRQDIKAIAVKSAEMLFALIKKEISSAEIANDIVPISLIKRMSL